MVLLLNYSSLSKQALNVFKTYLILHLKKYQFNFRLINLPKRIKRFTLLKSPHVNKKAKETFESIKYNFLLLIDYDIKFFNLLKNNLPKLIHLKWSYKCKSLYRIKK